MGGVIGVSGRCMQQSVYAAGMLRVSGVAGGGCGGLVAQRVADGLHGRRWVVGCLCRWRCVCGGRRAWRAAGVFFGILQWDDQVFGCKCFLAKVPFGVANVDIIQKCALVVGEVVASNAMARIHFRRENAQKVGQKLPFHHLYRGEFFATPSKNVGDVAFLKFTQTKSSFLGRGIQFALVFLVQQLAPCFSWFPPPALEAATLAERRPDRCG